MSIPKTRGLADALADFQQVLPHIDRSNTAEIKTDKSKYSYKYADLAEVSAAVLPILAKFGLSWTTMPTLDDQGKFVLHYQLMHTSGERKSGTYPLPAPNSAPQVLGSAITYARRYCLCAVTGVSPDEDDDDAAAQANAATTTEPDWDVAIAAAVRAKDKAHLARLWKKAGELRPHDLDLRARIKQAGEGLAAKQEPAGGAKTRPELERRLFALLGEGGITDSAVGRETRLRVLSRLWRKSPEISSLKDLTDTEVAGANDTLARWKSEGRLTAALADMSAVEDTSPAETPESEPSAGTDGT